MNDLLPWSTGFEDGFGDYTRVGGYCYAEPPASYQLVTSPVRQGQNAAAFTVAPNPGADFLQTRCVVQGDLPEAAFYAAHFYLPSAPTAANNWNLIHFRAPNVNNSHGLWDVSITPQPDGSLRVYVFDFLRMRMRAATGVTEVPVGQWFELGVYWHRANTPTGRFAVYVDGQLALDLQDLVTDDSTFAQWYVGNLAVSLTPSNYTLYVDDVSIRDLP